MLRNPVFTIAEDVSPDTIADHRHVLCPHYDTCLDEAIRKDRYFDCRWCEYKKKNIMVYLIHDGIPDNSEQDYSGSNLGVPPSTGKRAH